MTSFKMPTHLLLGTALLGGALLSCTGSWAGQEPFDVVEATIPEMQQALEEGRVTSRYRTRYCSSNAPRSTTRK